MRGTANYLALDKEEYEISIHFLESIYNLQQGFFEPIRQNIQYWNQDINLLMILHWNESKTENPIGTESKKMVEEG